MSAPCGNGWRWPRAAALAEGMTAILAGSLQWQAGAVAFMAGKALGRKRLMVLNGPADLCCGTGFIP
jgi:hypothetical protein